MRPSPHPPAAGAKGPDPDAPPRPSFGELVRTFAVVGVLSFGGPAGQIALMHRMLVEERRWIGESRFLRALNFCMLLPGPEAMQLATYAGWLTHGVRGGLVAGTLFVLPGFVVVTALSAAYAAFGEDPRLSGVFLGLKAAVVAVVLQALVRIARRALTTVFAGAVALAAFLALFAFALPFPLVIAAAALAGALAPRPDGAPAEPVPAAPGRGAARASLLVAAALVVAWFAPAGLIAVSPAAGGVFADIASFFSRMAVVTFGGAYAVLAYVAQEAVEAYGWLRPGEMLDGLALAETTPGPLILVLTFVGFMAAFRDPGALDPMLAGLVGGALATWVTFVPCFLWIFLGAPHMERLSADRRLAGALASVTAAVVGVIGSLALWFALHVVFDRVGTFAAGPLAIPLPDPASLDVAAALLTAAAALALFRLKLALPAVLGLAAAGGLLATALT